MKPEKTFCVWYARDGVGLWPRMRELAGLQRPTADALPDTHIFVGVFTADEPDDLFILMNEIQIGTRSMAAGDIVTYQGRALVCDISGWTDL